MIDFLRILGTLSVVGGMFGIFEYGFIDYGAGVTEPNVYVISIFAASALVSFGLFWGLAEIIYNLREINKNLEEGD